MWRVTKYNPKFRSKSGVYKIDDWTSSADIGKCFNGEVLSVEKYMDIEERYISTILHFLQESHVLTLSVNGLENNIVSMHLKKLNSIGLSHNGFDIHESDELRAPEILLTCRFVLRELLWCKLEKDNKFFIHFGHDYYMYIGSADECAESISYAQSIGLFVERFASPYL